MIKLALKTFLLDEAINVLFERLNNSFAPIKRENIRRGDTFSRLDFEFESDGIHAYVMLFDCIITHADGCILNIRFGRGVWCLDSTSLSLLQQYARTSSNNISELNNRYYYTEEHNNVTTAFHYTDIIHVSNT